MSDHRVHNSGATLIFVGGTDNGGELLHKVVDGLGVEQLLLALHDPGLALLAGHRVVLGGLADSSTHPVGLQKSRKIHSLEKVVNLCTSGE